MTFMSQSPPWRHCDVIVLSYCLHLTFGGHDDDDDDELMSSYYIAFVCCFGRNDDDDETMVIMMVTMVFDKNRIKFYKSQW